MFSRRCFVILIALLATLSTYAQKPDEAAKIKENRRTSLIEQSAADLQNLRLGENLAIIGVRIGNLTWKSDPERGRAMFMTAAAELIDAQTQAEVAHKRINTHNDLLFGGSVRTQMLTTIAGRDAELALELLVKTRPSTVARVMAGPVSSTKINSSGNYAHLAQNEKTMEQRFLRMAAEQNPERMIKLLKDALAKGLTHETVGLLRKLHEKDAPAAKEIAVKVIDKLLGTKFSFTESAGNEAAHHGLNFLTDFLQHRDRADKSFRFDDAQMRSLAEKLIAFYLTSPQGYFNPTIIQVAEKLSPGNVEKLKALSQITRYSHGFNVDVEVQNLIRGDTPVAEVLAAAKKSSAQNRHVLFDNAVSRLTNEGDLDQAMSVVADNYEGEALENAMNNLRSQQGHRLMNEGLFAEAERIFDELPENSRSYALLNLANSLYHKDRVENLAQAAAIVGKVRATLPERPESQNDMNSYMQVINAYANIESDEGFRIFEQLMPLINNLADAAAVINPFQGNTNVRNGEFLISNGLSYGNFGFDLGVITRFAGRDFDQTILLIDMFTRPETRILLRLQIAESLN